MGLEEEKPNNDEEPNANHHQFIINKNDIDVDQTLFDIIHPTHGQMATLGWIGIDSRNYEKIRQPVIWSYPINEVSSAPHLSYEGYANYMPKYFSSSFKHIATEHIVMPNDGTVFRMESNRRYFFNSYDAIVADSKYSLDSNNVSIIMNNISIYNQTYSIGCMINLRASFDGLLQDSFIDGNVIILCNVDYIG